MLIEDLEEYIKPFSRLVCNVERDEKATCVETDEYFQKYKITESDDYGLLGRVWMLIGKKNDESSFESLMVAQSENIQKEINANIYSMYNTEYSRQRESQTDWNFDKEVKYNLDVIKGPQVANINSNDSNYMYQVGDGNIKKQYLYRFLKKKYKYLKIYEIEIDKYLNPLFEMEQNERYIYELAKDYYAESKLALETNSIYWNFYNSGVGKRSYFYFRNRIQE